MNSAQLPIGRVWCPSSSVAPCAFSHLRHRKKPSGQLTTRFSACRIAPLTSTSVEFTKRAQLIGETTAGTFSFTKFTQLENGMILNVASVRHTFPDGSRFEGIGIRPDIEIHSTVQDMKIGKDVVLERALQLATQK